MLIHSPIRTIVRPGPDAYRHINRRQLLNHRSPFARDLVLWMKALPGFLPGYAWLDVTRLHDPVAGSTVPDASLSRSPGGWGSVHFPDNSGYYYAVTSDLLKLDGISWTFAAWVNSASANEDGLFSSSLSVFFKAINFMLRYDGGSNAGAWDGNAWRALTTAVAANTWTHIAYTYDRTALVMKAFHNGRLSNTYTSITTNFSSEDGLVWLGRRHQSIGLSPMNGQIDDMMLWRRALADSEVYDVYARSQQSWPITINRTPPPFFLGGIPDLSPIKGGRRRAGIIGG